MPKFKLLVNWETSSYVKVEADDETGATAYVENLLDEGFIPKDGDLVEGLFNVLSCEDVEG